MCNVIYIAKILLFIYMAESKRPHSKRQREIWRLECELGAITDTDCPIDGGWSSWSSWSSCQGTCDNVGHRTRVRECNNPLTSKDGTPCVGPDEQTETCFMISCSVDDFQRLVVGDASRTEALHQLQAVPALLERCLQIECPFEAVEAGLSSDNTWQLNSEALWNSLQCVKHNLGCPVKGEWGVWGSWSACSALCGKGLKWRLRRCDTPPPSDASLICSGSPLQSEDCDGDQCVVGEQYIEYSTGGSWSEWDQWSVCSENCGQGVRRRKRTCLERHIPLNSFSWGTHCRGQHDQLEICINNGCTLNGGWSGWGPWGPCSQTCGAGRRSRTRSCTRPIPSGDSKNCEGTKVEVGSCYLVPCDIYTHIVAVLNGDSYLQYKYPEKKSTLFHFYIRFMPLSPSGTLVRRGSLQNSYIRVSLQKWHICLDAGGESQSCSLTRICSSTALEPANWHSVLIAVSGKEAIIRLNNAQMSLKSTFPCDPELEENAINIFVGERFNGEIQELILNFIPLKMMVEKVSRTRISAYLPSFASNVAYEKANMDEAFLILENEYYIRLPCLFEHDEWRLELTLRPKYESGIILFLQNDKNESWLQMTMQNMRLKIKLAFREFRSESISSVDCLPNQWTDIALSKKQGTNIIEARINGGERLHVSLAETECNLQKRCKHSGLNHSSLEKRKNSVVFKKIPEAISFCNDEFFLGGVPIKSKSHILDPVPFSGDIASLTIDGVLLDLHNLSLERYKDDNLLVSSRTASVSLSYHEAERGISSSLNLTCLHARIAQTHNFAYWLFLDTTLNGDLGNKSIRIVDNGIMLRLIAVADDDIRGFYTCRAHTNKYTYNIVTYGVLKRAKYKLNSPDFTTIIAVFSTISLVIYTLSWLISEGINDLRNGHGFFRDAHFTPQEEAEAVCNYIDQNAHLFNSRSAMKLAKMRARRKARQLASRASFGAQEPQGLQQMQNAEILEMSNDSALSEFEVMPALPEIQSLPMETSHDVYMCEPTYISSPPHGSNITSPEPKFSSTSSFATSPRVLCSRLLLTKYRELPKKYNVSLKPLADRVHKTKSKLNTLSPAQKILRKFHQLKSDD